MNCEKCQDLLSEFLDVAIEPADARLLDAHLSECLHCFTARDEVGSIVTFCRDSRGQHHVALPDERAMWLRIVNTIEAERGAQAKAAAAATAAANPKPAARRESWWSRLMNRSWELSLPQMASAVAAIAIAVSLATAFGVRRMQGADATDSSPAATARATAPGGGVNVAFAVDGTTPGNGGHVWQQIDYWNQRVEARKNHWSPQMREAFDSNMRVIDQAVNDYQQELKARPHDDVSEEMLNAALDDKMELLREFSDL